MKHNKTSILKTATLALACSASLTSLSQAAITYQWVGGAGAVPTTLPSNVDLLQTNLSSATGVTYPQSFNDGVVNPSNNNPGGSITMGAGADTFNFDLVANPLGYDISEINIYTGWNDARAGQHYTLSYTPVGGALTTIHVINDGDDASFTASNGSLLSNSFNLGLTGVESITLTNVDTGLNSSGSVIREIDVFGVPTVVPEPSSTALLGLGALGLIARRRRA